MRSEACIARVTDRAVQGMLEVELNDRQLILSGCTETPRTVSGPIITKDYRFFLLHLSHLVGGSWALCWLSGWAVLGLRACLRLYPGWLANIREVAVDMTESTHASG